MSKEIIELDSSLTKDKSQFISKIRIASNIFETSCSLNKDTNENLQRKSRYPLKEMDLDEDNSKSLDLNASLKGTKTTAGQGRGRNKRRQSNKNVKSPKSPNIFNKPYNIAEMGKVTPIQKDSKASRNLFENSKSQEVSPALAKMLARHQELKSCIEKSRQAFSAYKVSTFFCFNTDFIKSYGDKLLKTEQSILSLGSILEDNVSNKHPSGIPVTESNDEIFCLSPLETDLGLKEAVQSSSSITPPPSEIGKEDRSLLMEESNPSKKRRVTPRNTKKAASKVTKATRRTRRCTVSTPVAPKMVRDTPEMLELAEKIESDPVDEESDTEPNEPEFEVRKIQDYVRKQSGFYYRVSWCGYESDEDTFEPADHLDGCEDALVDFIYTRLKKRQNVTTAEELKRLTLPSEEKVRQYVYEAFLKLSQPLSESTLKKGVAFVSAAKAPSFKSVEEVQDDILKFLALRDPTQERYKKAYASIIEQLSFKELFKDRQKQLADLRAWERSMNIISSDPAPLTVENNVDLELPPLDFVYINEYHPGPGIFIPNDPIAGCECKECNSLQKGCCAGQMGSYYAYNKNARLRVSLGTPIYECNKACKCPPDCSNRVVQNGRKVGLSIFRTANNRGWGVKAMEVIKKDQFVSEYVGEVISSEEAEHRGMQYDTKGCTYLFDLDYNKGDQNPYTVDAVKYGNVSHFINHSCDPNLVVFNVWVNCLDPDLPKLALFAARDIKKGEEVTFDYNSGSTRQISIIDKVDEKESSTALLTPSKRCDDAGDVIIPTTDLILKTPRNRVVNMGKTECKCGAANCRKYFF